MKLPWWLNVRKWYWATKLVLLERKAGKLRVELAEQLRTRDELIAELASRKTAG